jgi:molybdopterin-guanine dinucleotide biosynthesis protein B
MPSVVSIVGKSNSGKTTIIDKLVRELKSRNYRIATVKHVTHDITLDIPGKDSWRHIQAGSDATAISSPRELVLIKPTISDASISEIGRLFSEDYDLIIIEGFKRGNAPKIEIHRKDVGTPLRAVKKLVAVVTDEPIETKARQFSLNDCKGLADFLEKSFIKSQKERTSLYINNTNILLSSFLRKFITNVLLSMLNSLKNIEEIDSLDFSFRKTVDKD